MATTTPRSQKSESELPPWILYSCMAAAVIGPIALLIPPRRFGVQSMILGGSSFQATNILACHYTGESVNQRFMRRIRELTANELPEQAQRTQELLRQERARREAILPEKRNKLQEEPVKKELASNGASEKFWTGRENSDWMEERAKQEKEALEEGRGYIGLIWDQVREVFGSKGGDGPNSRTPPENEKKK